MPLYLTGVKVSEFFSAVKKEMTGDLQLKITCKTDLIRLFLETFHYTLRSVIQCPVSLLVHSQQKE